MYFTFAICVHVVGLHAQETESYDELLQLLKYLWLFVHYKFATNVRLDVTLLFLVIFCCWCCHCCCLVLGCCYAVTKVKFSSLLVQLFVSSEECACIRNPLLLIVASFFIIVVWKQKPNTLWTTSALILNAASLLKLYWLHKHLSFFLQMLLLF